MLSRKRKFVEMVKEGKMYPDIRFGGYSDGVQIITAWRIRKLYAIEINLLNGNVLI